MVFAAVTWAYKEVVTSAKLGQMVANLLEHDHRSDGSQGAALTAPWVNVTGVTPATGWSITGTPRYRLLAASGLVAVDVLVARTGAAITGADVTAATPGNVADTTVLTGWPAAARPSKSQTLVGEVGGTNPATVRIGTDGSFLLIYLSPSAPVATNDTITLRGTIWLG